MTLVRLRPFEYFEGFDDRAARLFPREEGESGASLSTGTWAPNVDVYEQEGNLTLKAEVPGMKPEDIEVRVEDGRLYLRGERRFERSEENEKYHRVERSYGSFERVFTLPTSVDTSTVQADYKDGVLTLTLPKREDAKPKAIKINVSKN